MLSPQFQTELRRILVSLIEVAQKLLALNPDAVELFKKANGKSGPQAEAHPRPSLFTLPTEGSVDGCLVDLSHRRPCLHGES